jgi:hypothetical protein
VRFLFMMRCVEYVTVNRGGTCHTYGSLHYLPSKASAAYKLTTIVRANFGHHIKGALENNNPFHRFKFEFPFIPTPVRIREP